MLLYYECSQKETEFGRELGGQQREARAVMQVLSTHPALHRCAISTAERQTVVSQNLLLCPALIKQKPNRSQKHLQSN